MPTLTIDRQINFEALNSVLAPSAYYVESWNRSLVGSYVPRSASISSNVDTALAFLMSKGIDVEDSVAVENFLTNHYGMVTYLYDAPEKISQSFGETKLKLGIFSDPDDGGDQGELYLEIETGLSPEEANERLSGINREWLFASADQDLMSLNITLRFA